MERNPGRMGRRLAVPALAAVAAALPFAVGPGGIVEPQTACAQSGSCRRSIGSVCFVNGNAYIDVEWVAPDGG